MKFIISVVVSAYGYVIKNLFLSIYVFTQLFSYTIKIYSISNRMTKYLRTQQINRSNAYTQNTFPE